MNIDEAKEAMQRGEKVTHRFFTPDEFIAFNGNGDVITEEKRYQPVPFDWFMEQRNSIAWSKDWSIFKG